MFGPFDHVGYLVRDFDAALEQAQVLFALPVARTAELPQFGITAAFLGEGSGTLEIFTIADRELLDPRLDGAGDHRRARPSAHRAARAVASSTPRVRRISICSKPPAFSSPVSERRVKNRT